VVGVGDGSIMVPVGGGWPGGEDGRVVEVGGAGPAETAPAAAPAAAAPVGGKAAASTAPAAATAATPAGAATTAGTPAPETAGTLEAMVDDEEDLLATGCVGHDLGRLARGEASDVTGAFHTGNVRGGVWSSSVGRVQLLAGHLNFGFQIVHLSKENVDLFVTMLQLCSSKSHDMLPLSGASSPQLFGSGSLLCRQCERSEVAGHQKRASRHCLVSLEACTSISSGVERNRGGPGPRFLEQRMLLGRGVKVKLGTTPT
jgi:hypothetical protein